MDLEKICLQVINIAKEVGDFILFERENFSASGIETKGTHNFVTHVDKAAEEKLVSRLRSLIPGSGFITEEGTGVDDGEKYRWIIDPLDGTTNFIHGSPPYAISIALMEDKEIILGVINEMTLKESFYAWKGSKAFLNGREISVSSSGKIVNSLIATGFPYTDYSMMEQFMKSMEYFMKYSHGLRRLGSAATDLAYVACGRYDAFYEYGLNSWDMAAGVFIIQQAGGKNCDFAGGDDYIFGGTLISSNAAIFDELRGVIKKIMLPRA